MSRGKDFADLIYRVLVVEKRKPLEDVAKQMGLSYHSLHARLHCKILFSVDEARRLMEILQSSDVADYLLGESGMIGVPREEEVSKSETDSLFRRTNHLAIETADVLAAVEEALKDDKLDHRDRQAIQSEIIEAERSLASLRAALGPAA